MTSHAPLLNPLTGVMEGLRTTTRILTISAAATIGNKTLFSASLNHRPKIFGVDLRVSGQAGIAGGGVSVFTIQDGATPVHVEAVWFPDPATPVPGYACRLLWVPGQHAPEDPRGQSNGYTMSVSGSLLLNISVGLGAGVLVSGAVTVGDE